MLPDYSTQPDRCCMGKRGQITLTGDIRSCLLRKTLEMQSLGTAKTKLNANTRKRMEGSITSTGFWSCMELGNQISGVGGVSLLLAKGYSIPQLNCDLLFTSTLPVSNQAPGWVSPCHTGLWHSCIYSAVQEASGRTSILDSARIIK